MRLRRFGAGTRHASVAQRRVAAPVQENAHLMETRPPMPRAILVGVQTPDVDDVAHAASLEELGRLVKTLGYEVIGTVSQKREGNRRFVAVTPPAILSAGR